MQPIRAFSDGRVFGGSIQLPSLRCNAAKTAGSCRRTVFEYGGVERTTLTTNCAKHLRMISDTYMLARLE